MASRHSCVQFTLRQIGLGMFAGPVLCVGVSFVLARGIGNENAFPLSAYTLAPLLLMAVALLASWLPARSAARVQPTEALREG